MSDNNNEPIDLGSDPIDEFDPFANDDDLADDAENDTAASVVVQSQPSAKPVTRSPEPKHPEAMSAPDNGSADANITQTDNPLEDAIDNAEAKDAEKSRQSIFEKVPVFEYAGATENIDDSSQTFDELRIAKAADFPELDDGKRVSWTIEYGKITKTVSNVKGTSIGKMKSDIETSKEFLDALKKARDKNPVCKIKPRVTAQSKGASPILSSGYKDVFTCMADVDAAGKAISILPAKDGNVYEIRDNDLGRFITPVVGCELLSDVQAGFTPALGIPRIPMNLTMQIIAFFRHFTCHYADNEALVNIYWDKLSEVFIVDTPEQIVSKTSVCCSENLEYVNERYIHYMDIHSHNSMGAFFSSIDNEDEKATRLYTVIGCLDKFFPEIKTRISNGGKFHEIDPGEVFEYIGQPFPNDWKEKVHFRASHKDNVGATCIVNHCCGMSGAKDFPCDIFDCMSNIQDSDTL